MTEQQLDSRKRLLVEATRINDNQAIVKLTNLPSRKQPDPFFIECVVDGEGIQDYTGPLSDEQFCAAAEMQAVQYHVITKGIWADEWDPEKNLPFEGSRMQFYFKHYDAVNEAHEFMIKLLMDKEQFSFERREENPIAAFADVLSNRLDRCKIFPITEEMRAIEREQKFPETNKEPALIHLRSRTEQPIRNTQLGKMVWATRHALLKVAGIGSKQHANNSRGRNPVKKLVERLERNTLVQPTNLHKLRFFTDRWEIHPENVRIEVWREERTGVYYILSERDTNLFNMPVKYYIEDVVAVSREAIEEYSSRYEAENS